MLNELQHVPSDYKNKALHDCIKILALTLRQQIELKLVTIIQNIFKQTENCVKLTYEFFRSC